LPVLSFFETANAPSSSVWPTPSDTKETFGKMGAGGAEVAYFPKGDVLDVGAAAAAAVAEVIGCPKRDVLEVGAAAVGAEVVGAEVVGAEVVGCPKRDVLEVGAAAGGVEVGGSLTRGARNFLEASTADSGGAEVARVPKSSGGAAEDPVAEGSEELDAKADVCEVLAGFALEEMLVLAEDSTDDCRNERFSACVVLETLGGN
jgi:hypothetical protein